MADFGITRRGSFMAFGLVGAWMASPLRAAVRPTGSVPTPAFIEALMSRMTLEEKAGQLTLNPAAMRVDAAAALNPKETQQKFDAQLADAVAGNLTGVFNGSGAAMAQRMQSAVMRESRLKIPLIFAADVIHGYRTVFPIPVGEAASFDPSLAERTARATAVEAAAAGIDWTFAPMVDIARDQRWGRVMEGAGEDVRLGSLFAVARVRGFQGEDPTASDAMLACAKHFAAYGAPEGGLDYNGADMSERTLREIYLPPFRAAFEAGARTTMAAFNALAGVPASANGWLLTDLLRGEWHFPGVVVSDYKGDEELIAHGVAKDGKDAARLAFLAGVDMSMASNLYALHLPDLVREGAIPEERVDASVRRVLMLKAKIGLFDDPFRRIDPAREKARSRLPGALALAREAGRKSIVMLKNDNDTLPLKKSARVALIGPFAAGAHDLIGGWAVFSSDDQAVDLATGMRAAGGNVTVAAGCAVDDVLPGQIDEALAVARSADVVVLSLGESQQMSGEAASRTEIVLPAAQQRLAEAIVALGKPTIVVLRNGRALALDGAVLDAHAILVSWFLGTQSGHSIADVLYGEHGPAGRLPMSFPFKSGQEPYHYDHASTGRPQPIGPIKKHRTNYLDAPNGARFAFGHGLTFGAPVYSDFSVGTPVLAWNGKMEVSARITNTGSRACEELAQCYLRDSVAHVAPPVRRLIGFQKVSLGPGESTLVRFELRRDQLEYIGLDNKPTVEPGEFRVWIAPSAQDEGATGTFTLASPD